MMHPYFGLSVGTAVAVNSVSAPGVASVSKTKVYFEGLARPGIEFNLTTTLHLDIEPAVGLLSDQFAFQPHAALSIGF